MTSEWLDEPVQGCVRWLLPGSPPDATRFAELARRALRYMKRNLAVSRFDGGFVVPRWANCLAEAACCMFVDPALVLTRAKVDEEFKNAARAAVILGGFRALRDFVGAEFSVG